MYVCMYIVHSARVLEYIDCFFAEGYDPSSQRVPWI